MTEHAVAGLGAAEPAAGGVVAGGVVAGGVVAGDLAAGDLAARAIAQLAARGLTIGAAESLTGGLVTAALTTVPGASAVVRGGIVAYAADVKNQMLGVDADMLARVGTVHPDVAVAMARGARERLGAAVGVATTGVAGPDPADGQPVGTVHIAVSASWATRHRELALSGDRAQIRQGTVNHVLALLLGTLEESVLMEDNE